MKEVVKRENVTKKFKGEQVLKGVSLDLEPGKIYGIVGKNGSGKTVLFKCIIGLLKVTTGTIYVHDKNIGKETDFAEDAGIIIEKPGFINGYTGFENLKYLAEIRHIIGDSEIKKAMIDVGLEPESKKKTGKYSLGMKQKLAFAQAIMEKPQLLVLDEPMNGLDQESIKNIKQLLIGLKEKGTTILMSSHYLEDTEMCDELYKMKDGKIYRLDDRQFN